MGSLTPVFHCESLGFSALLTTEKSFFTRALKRTFNGLDLPNKKYRVAVVFADDATLRQLNRDFRHKDKPTNVLSFPQFDDFTQFDSLNDPIELGDIFLGFETIAREAGAQDKSLRDHVTHLLVHGLLHIMGYDHDTDKNATQMEAFEIDILTDLGIRNPYGEN